MNYLFIIIPAIVIAIVLLYSALKGAVKVEEDEPFIMQEEPKFQPRKVTDLSKAVLGTDPIVIPKKKKNYYKKKTKKAE